MNYSIKPIVAGSFGYVREDIMFEGGNPAVSHIVPSFIYHISAPGHSYIVDTSFSSAEKCRRIMNLWCHRESDLSGLLLANGVIPDEVESVILTHLHWDHAGNINLFPHASVICQKQDLDFFMTDLSLNQEYRDELVEVADRMTLIDGDFNISSGIILNLVGGHTPGSQTITVQTENGHIIISGDVAMHRINVNKRLPVGLSVDAKKSRLAIEKIVQSGNAVLPSHDWMQNEMF